MKKSFYFLMTIGLALNFVCTVSCNKQPTYEELKAAELKLINRILKEKNIEVLTEYPKDSVFGENQFLLLESGIYLNVVDSGNGNRAVLNETTVLVRTSGEYYESDKTVAFSTFTNTSYPFEFKYGQASLVVSERSYAYDYYSYFGTGIEHILTYVGENAVVKLIVPGYSEIRIGNSTIGAASSFQIGDRYNFVPIYYDRVKYTFY